jgi:hypothetical protein
VEAYTFGSVPLRTYLPDGDIDISVFTASGSSLKDTWAHTLVRALEREQAKLAALFRLRDAQIIDAEARTPPPAGAAAATDRFPGRPPYPTPTHRTAPACPETPPCV